MLEIEKIILDVSNEKLEELNNNNFLKAGKNGPYNIQETFVRNHSHWISIFKYLYLKTNKKKYLNAIIKLADSICYNADSGENGAIRYFDNNNKMDTLNGLIGQAWIIEGLIQAFIITKKDIYYDKAIKIFLSQKYDYDLHLWKRIDIDGNDIGYDKVFNHQLWFAASGFMIINVKHNRKIFKEINDFMLCVDKNFNIYDDGLFKHYCNGFNKDKKGIKFQIKKVLSFLSFIDPRFDSRYFEKAYHLYNLYGFALIKELNSNYDIFSSNKLKLSIEYGNNISKLNNDFNIKYFIKNKKSFFIKYNKYAYSYNSPAFLYPYINLIFNDKKNSELLNKLIKLQIDFSYDKECLKFSRNTCDTEVLTARLYELTRYLERMNVYDK